MNYINARHLRLRQIAAHLDIPLTRHPEQDLSPVRAADLPRWRDALAKDAEVRAEADRAEDARGRLCVAPVGTATCRVPAATMRTVEDLECALCAKHAEEFDAETHD
jgi:hypothetical protein